MEFESTRLIVSPCGQKVLPNECDVMFKKLEEKQPTISFLSIYILNLKSPCVFLVFTDNRMEEIV